MKIIIFISMLALASADWRIQTHADLIRYRDECVSALGVPENLIENYKNWVFPNDENTHCYIKCVFIKMGLFDKNGFIVDYLVQQLMSQSKTNNNIRTEILKCIGNNNLNKHDSCTYAYRGFVCLNKNHIELIQLSVRKGKKQNKSK